MNSQPRDKSARTYDNVDEALDAYYKNETNSDAVIRLIEREWEDMLSNRKQNSSRQNQNQTSKKTQGAR